MDDVWLRNISYADDILLVSTTKQELEEMMGEVIEAFAVVGLDVGAEKTHWTSHPQAPDEVLKKGRRTG